MNNMIAIRADGNSEIGFGHLMRTKALARELVKQGAEVIFLSKNPENIKEYQVLPLEHQNRNEEVLLVGEMLKDLRAGMLIIDSYAYTQEQLDRAGQFGLLTVYIDDLNRHPLNTDFVVNGNIYAPELPYRGRARFLLGLKYLLLREEFAGLPKRSAASCADNVLLTFGAADMGNVTPGILHALKNYHQFQRLNWHVAIGPVFQNTGAIEAAAQDYPNILLHYNPDLKELMDHCDMCISAAGSTAYELAACGVPALLVIIADNQVRLAQAAERQGMAINLGWHQQLDTKRLYSALDNLLDNRDLRTRMAARGQELIDGRGAQRVAAELLSAAASH
ncbi:UDP-2,4-diacetamido-2,4,6-trideoxy-beta-L-altropyranose hydrolase [Syntrophomonas wolfei]|uniref:UDP-2,4-diacetamido-2,4, 6-trideoxy-beta-L-altropyranose hydrolase n=1 Tax=Syntrophomonas wolfei TaxID=863 RepID=UPI0023F4A2D0|nr:UDP-2,4-diacetamido-2,4,6-trideoxy-beta-L-altropyranose hydrolase [Syntrophomonas wolfei]